MPTKKRREKEKAKHKEWESLGELPDHLKNKNDGSNIKNPFDTNIPFGLVKEVDGELVLHQNTGKGGNQKREDDKWDLIEDLYKNYREVWFKRGSSKTISYETGIPVRTIQNYQKLTRDKLKAQGQAKP